MWPSGTRRSEPGGVNQYQVGEISIKILPGKAVLKLPSSEPCLMQGKKNTVLPKQEQYGLTLPLAPSYTPSLGPPSLKVSLEGIQKKSRNYVPKNPKRNRLVFASSWEYEF